MDNKIILDVKITRGPSYDFEEAIRDTTVYCEQMPFGFISEQLKAEINSWTPEVPIGAFSDTGTGKNFFAENVLAQEAAFHRQGVLIISNRVALGRQVKRRIAKMFNEEWKLEDYSEQGIDGLTDFGNITVVSYQQLEEWLNQNSCNLKKLRRDFRYIVMDEIHYCLSDCSFNAMTDLVLNYITTEFHDSIRVYMTATPEQIFPLLMQKETNVGEVRDTYGRLRGFYKWHVYQFAHNFEQIEPYAFQTQEDLVALIKKSDDKEKWVMFVENKEIGRSIIQACGFGVIITAESKNLQCDTYDTYMDIVKNERFREKLLVCTSVLENGVNLKDPGLKNIVIYANDKNRFLQMLGRVRRTPEQIINLYISNEDLSSVSCRIESLKAQIAALSMYYANPTAFCSQFITDSNPRAKVRGAFTVMRDGYSHINGLREIQIDSFELPFWKRIKELMDEGDSFALLREKFSWISKEFTQESILRGKGYERALTQFILFLESNVNAEIPKNAQEEFKKDFSEKYRAVYGKREEDKQTDQIYGLSIMKECLLKSESPYEILNERNYWIVKRMSENLQEN